MRTKIEISTFWLITKKQQDLPAHSSHYILQTNINTVLC